MTDIDYLIKMIEQYTMTSEVTEMNYHLKYLGGLKEIKKELEG